MELRKKKSVNLWFLSTAKHNLLTTKCNHCSWRKLVTDLTVKSEGKMTVCQYKCYSRVLFLGMLKGKLNSVCVCLCVSTASILDLHFLTLRPHCGKLPKSACCGFLRLCWSFCAVCSCVSAAPIDAWLNQLVEKSEVCRGKRGMVRLLHFQLGSLALQSFKVNDHLWEHTL